MSKKTNRQGKKPAGGNAAVAHMNDALLEEFSQIKALAIKADRQNVQARYEIAVHCQKVREGDGIGGVYGDRAVARLAKALGWGKSNVYGYANVALAWPDKKNIDELAALEDKHGRPLSWTHIVQLATVATAERRDELIADTLKHGWNVRELRKKLQPNAAGSVEEDSAAVPQPKTPRVLDAAVQNYVTQVSALKGNTTTFGEHLVEEINDADPVDLTDAFVDRLNKARQDLCELLKQLDEYIEQVKQRRSVPIQPQGDWEDVTSDQTEHELYFGKQDHSAETLVGTV